MALMRHSGFDMSDFRQRVENFIACFNKGDLDAVMATIADAGVYTDFDGSSYSGLEEVRKGLEPIFTGAFGDVHTQIEDIFLDEPANKAAVSYRLTMTAADGSKTTIDAQDILQFDGDKLRVKDSYAKAKEVLVLPV